jgi:CBS domain-containing protein
MKTAKDVMSTSPVIADLDSTILQVAKMMKDYGLGSILVADDISDPKILGIITDQDIVSKVVANGLDPKEVKAKEIMSTPLFTMPSDASLREVAQQMGRLGVRRIPIVEGGKLRGLVTEWDLVKEELELIMVTRDLVPKESEDPIDLGGSCESCGAYSARLQLKNGLMLCDDCAELYK